jgi:hypothetical protein
MFKNDTHKFHPSNELVMCMPFQFIDGLDEKTWHHINNKWLKRLMKHLKQAQSSNTKQIRFIRHIGRDDFYKQSTKYVNKDDCHIYEIFQMNKVKCCVNFGHISDIIGEEEWLQGEFNCLCNIASSQIISLLWGAKKKESKNSHDSCLCVGDRVSMANHGNNWIHLAKICSIDKSTKLAVVKWDETLKKDTVNLADCKQYDKLDGSQRKCKSTDFFLCITNKKWE